MPPPKESQDVVPRPHLPGRGGQRGIGRGDVHGQQPVHRQKVWYDRLKHDGQASSKMNGTCGAKLGAAGRLSGRLASAGVTFTNSSPLIVSSALAECGSTGQGSWMLCSRGICTGIQTHITPIQ